jgi:hypothetical protein
VVRATLEFQYTFINILLEFNLIYSFVFTYFIRQHNLLLALLLSTRYWVGLAQLPVANSNVKTTELWLKQQATNKRLTDLLYQHTFH